jgi:thimet oligopeptidase
VKHRIWRGCSVAATLCALVGALAAPAAEGSATAPLIAYPTVDSGMIEAETEAAMQRADAILAEMVAPKGERTFDDTMRPLSDVANLLGQAFGKYSFLGYVAPDSALRDVARAREEVLNKYSVDLGFREDIYDAVKAYAGTDEAKRLEGERARYLAFTLRDYRRNGFEESKETRAKIQEQQKRLVELGLEFEKNLAEWKDGIELPPDRTAGLPESYLARLEKKENGNYWVSLDYPDYFPFLENAADAQLRRELMVKAWNQGYPRNVELLEEAIAIRDEMGKLLGYESWAHYRLETRMAKDPGTALGFLKDLQQKVRPKFEADLARMQESYDDPDGIDYWDWRYYHTQQLKNEFRVDALKVAEYFPLERVLEGMFDITQEMFGLRYVEIEHPEVWHPDVKLFEVYDVKTGEFIGHFYTDLFPRDGKFGHAAAFPLRGSGVFGGKRQPPISAIVANFTKPTETTPSLLTHDEVETLFHEFGHILHQTLTRAETYRFAGAETEQDFVEAPSQNLEHWIWEPEVLDRFAAHYETGEKIPREMLDGMIAAKHLNSGIETLRQIFYASLDMAYSDRGAKKNTTEILDELHSLCGFPNIEGTHFQAGFGHLFGYDAAYYGYLWSKVYGDDMYTAFAEGGILNPEIGMRYRREIYEKGGTVDGIDLVRSFLGREPNADAFLADLGLTPERAGGQSEAPAAVRK